MRAALVVVATLLCGACAADSETGLSATAKTYSGTYSTQIVESTVTTSLLGGGTFPCTNTYTMSGTLTMTIDEAGGVMVGKATVDGTQTETAHSNGDSCVAKGNLTHHSEPPLTGTTSDIRFDVPVVATNPNYPYTVTSHTTFTGALANGAVTGVLGFSVSGSGTITTGAVSQNYSAKVNVTLK